MQAGIRVLVISDQRILAESINARLKAEDVIDHVGVILNAAADSCASLGMAYDIAVINTFVELEATLQLVRQLKSQFPRLKILLWGLYHDDDESIIRLIEAGISGYLSRKASFEELLEGIKGAHSECACCTPHIVARVIKRISQLARERSTFERGLQVKLTAREQVILELIAQGLANKQIAYRLNISPFTVKNHVHNILDKLKVRYRRVAIRRAYEIGLLNQTMQSQLPSQLD